MLEAALISAERRARVELNHAVLRFVNGVSWLLQDPAKLVGRTPFDVIYRRGKLTVRRYRPPPGARRPAYAIPVLMVPPLMVKPFIFDLFPGRSLVMFLLERGFRVYVVDFGEPDDADHLVRLDDYVLRWLPAACRAVKRHAGTDELTLLGYCMGATFSLAHVAANRDRSVRNIVDLAAPVDVDALGVFAWVAKMAALQAEGVVRRIGNVPGGLSSTAFRLLAPTKNVTRYVDLFMNMWNREYVKGFEAMNQWVRQFIDYPQEAFLQFSREFVRKNKLVKGQMRFGNKVADLRRVEASLLVFAGRTDRVAPARAVRAVLDAVGSSDAQFHLVPGGHMGLFAGRTAPERVWEPIAAWLVPRSRRRRARGTRRAATSQPQREGRSAPRRSRRT